MTRILLIDDDYMIRDGVADLLKLEGYDVIEAAGGLEGLALAQQHQPDLIISDIQMPDISGFDVVQRLRDDALLVDIPVVFITAFSNPETEARSRNLNINGYITKPFSYNILFDVIAECLQ